VVLLGVDDWNPTGAMKLYERIGSSVKKKDFTFEKQLQIAHISLDLISRAKSVLIGRPFLGMSYRTQLAETAAKHSRRSHRTREV